MDTVIQFLQNINWGTPTWDIFIVLFFVIATFIYGLSLGRNRIIVIVVSIYMALSIVHYAPFLKKDMLVNFGNGFVFQLTSFLGAFIILFFLLSRSALLRTIADTNSGAWWHVFIFSILQVGLLISIALSFLPEDALAQLSDTTLKIFATENARFAWIIGPIIMMTFMSKNDD